MSEPVTFTLHDGTVLTFDPLPPVQKPVDAPTAADCTSCGACCLESGHVAVTPADATPPSLTRSPEGLGLSRETLCLLGSRCMKQHLGGRCVALEGIIGENASCSIYASRPEVCRKFKVGSPGCLTARERMRYKMSSSGRWRGYGADWRETVE